jgi:Listeria-Bacteroides repeat domain (List_Bact_rpt).
MRVMKYGIVEVLKEVKLTMSKQDSDRGESKKPMAVILVLLALLCVGFWFIFGRIKTYTVTFDSNGGTVVESQDVKKNEKVERPENPTREGYTFDSWHLGEKAYDFDEKVTEEFTLIAKWSVIAKTDSDGDSDGVADEDGDDTNSMGQVIGFVSANEHGKKKKEDKKKDDKPQEEKYELLDRTFNLSGLGGYNGCDAIVISTPGVRCVIDNGMISFEGTGSVNNDTIISFQDLSRSGTVFESTSDGRWLAKVNSFAQFVMALNNAADNNSEIRFMNNIAHDSSDGTGPVGIDENNAGAGRGLVISGDDSAQAPILDFGFQMVDKLANLIVSNLQFEMSDANIDNFTEQGGSGTVGAILALAGENLGVSGILIDVDEMSEAGLDGAVYGVYIGEGFAEGCASDCGVYIGDSQILFDEDVDGDTYSIWSSQKEGILIIEGNQLSADREIGIGNTADLYNNGAVAISGNEYDFDGDSRTASDVVLLGVNGVNELSDPSSLQTAIDTGTLKGVDGTGTEIDISIIDVLDEVRGGTDDFKVYVGGDKGSSTITYDDATDSYTAS